MMNDYLSNSYLFGGNAPYVEEMYEQYLNTPARFLSSGVIILIPCKICLHQTGMLRQPTSHTRR